MTLARKRVIMMAIEFGLSKSKLTAFEQCARKLWLSKHRPELEIVGEDAQARFETGHAVGALACSLVPTGVMIDAEPNLEAAIDRTRELIDGGWRGPIFEATFEHDGVLVRVDILSPDEGTGWAIAEVKSSASMKDYHLGDLATQVWVAREAGLEITSASIRHIDTSFRLTSEGDYQGLFKDAQGLEAIDTTLADRAALVVEARAVLAGDEPALTTGEHCSSPFSCGFVDYCRSKEPPGPEWPISLLPRGKATALKWSEQGVLDLREVPEGAFVNATYERIRNVTVSGVAYHDREGAVGATAMWSLPRAYLDFETINPAIPLWVGTRPFQQIPFQYSCHFEDERGDLRQTGYLSIDGTDPRRGLAEQLISDLGGDACRTIVAYNASFEKLCVRELAAAFPDLKSALDEIETKIVDLLPVTRDHYYHRDQRGSWSIKAVLPTIAPELSYDDLDVQHGTAAQAAWFEASRTDTSEERRAELRNGLERYCERDTEAMVVLLRRLVEPASPTAGASSI